MNINELGKLEPLARDVSPRQYFRGVKEGRSFILMTYPDVTPEHRAELLEFIRIGEWLSNNGIKTPKLYDLDKENCKAIFEDLGKISFGKYLQENPSSRKELYILATDILKKLSTIGAPDNLPLYKDSKIHENRRQLIDYYATFLGKNADMQGYIDVWQKIESTLPPCKQGFVHGDYHLENLMYVDGICALIDYQDALYGPLPYDLVNLLEDARIDVPKDLRAAMIDRYCKDMSASDKDIFLKWYRVLGTQFHCRVLGLFIKLAAEQGRDSYLIHIPRLQNYINYALQDPILSPLKAYFEKEKLDFTPIKDLNGQRIREIFN